MADFIQAFQKTDAFEGGYSDRATDRGGETYRGVARNRNPRWDGWEIVDSYKDDPHFPEILDLDDDLVFRVERLYKQEYWDVNSLDNIRDQRIAEELYDTGVNMGTNVAAMFLQRALNVTNRNGRDYPDIMVDGNIGPATLNALDRNRELINVLKTLNILQGARYIQICELDPSQEENYNGWLKRVGLCL